MGHGSVFYFFNKMIHACIRVEKVANRGRRLVFWLGVKAQLEVK
jgi:hypothetical protein